MAVTIVVPLSRSLASGMGKSLRWWGEYARFNNYFSSQSATANNASRTASSAKGRDHGETLRHLWQGATLRPHDQPRPQPHESSLEPKFTTDARADPRRRQAHQDLYALFALGQSAEGILTLRDAICPSARWS